MKYIEVVKAVREEQMKKEASVKKLAGLLKKKAAQPGTAGMGLAVSNESYRTPRNQKYINNLPNNAITLVTGDPKKVSVLDGKKNTTLAQMAKEQAAINAGRVGHGVSGLGFYTQKLLNNLSTYKQSLPQRDLKSFQQKLQNPATRQEVLKTIPGYHNVLNYLPIGKADLFWEAVRRQAKTTPAAMTNTQPA